MRRIALLGATLLTLLIGAFVSATPALAATPPTVSAVTVSNVASTSVTLSATVNLNGNAPSSQDLLGGSPSNCFFDLGTANPPTTASNCTSQLSTSATGTVTITANVTGLTAGTRYYVDGNVVTGGSSLLGVIGSPGTATAGPVTSFSTTAPTATTGSATPLATTATLNGTVNPEGWTLSSCQFIYCTSAGSLTSSAPCASTPSGTSATGVSAAVKGLSPGTTYYYELVVGYGNATAAGAPAQSFTTTTAGTETTEPATSVSATAAQLNATVNPQGRSVTACEFVYYIATSKTPQTAPCSVSAATLSGQNTDVPVNAVVTGLTPGATYGFDVLLQTDSATTAGQILTFTTPVTPIATTRGPSGVTSTVARLNGTVDAKGAGITGCAFEYGVKPLPASPTGPDAGLAVSCSPKPTGTGSQNVSLTLRGLAPNTTYYYRVLVSTSAGYVVANTVSFKTKAAGAVGAPGMKITRASIDKKRLQASFHFAHTGAAASRGAQCALVKVTHGKAGKASYKKCKSGIVEKKLKKNQAYVFYVRGGNSAGWGKAASKKFTA